jgi:hypothetical protein
MPRPDKMFNPNKKSRPTDRPPESDEIGEGAPASSRPATHGSLVSALAKTGAGGKAVSALASSKNKRAARRQAIRNRLRRRNG